MNKRESMHRIASWLFVPSLGAALAACSENRPSFVSVDVTGADYAKDVALLDHNGQQRSLKDFAGKIVVVFFGYTQCPDVCPTTMAELVEIRKALGADGARVQALFVTVAYWRMSLW